MKIPAHPLGEHKGVLRSNGNDETASHPETFQKSRLHIISLVCTHLSP